jgi:hypothetical protein
MLMPRYEQRMRREFAEELVRQLYALERLAAAVRAGWPPCRQANAIHGRAVRALDQARAMAERALTCWDWQPADELAEPLADLAAICRYARRVDRSHLGPIPMSEPSRPALDKIEGILERLRVEAELMRQPA